MSDEPRAPLPADRYDDRGPFAHGGTAAVHLIVDRVLGRPVATKVAKSQEPEHLHRFRKEACITAQLEHPNIVPVHDLGPTWFTMKRIEGATLSALVRAEPFGVVLLGRVIDILLKVCDALGYAHERGVVHRDVKPENVMVGRFGQVYLMDWGIAQVEGHADAPYAGTTAWVAPEQARGEVCDARTDVFGVGGLLYFVLCGGRPNVGKEPEDRLAFARAGSRARPPSEVAPNRALPPELVRIAMKALEPDPARRYANTAELAADLDAVRAGGWWFERRAFPADTEIVREGDAADAAYILVEGTVEVRQNGGPIAELGPGEIFGEAALLTGGTRTASVIALTDVVARVLTR
ncbi:MAG: serine/threonine-protein kinase, partial [Myxococcota bacterium]